MLSFWKSHFPWVMVQVSSHWACSYRVGKMLLPNRSAGHRDCIPHRGADWLRSTELWSHSALWQISVSGKGRATSRHLPFALYWIKVEDSSSHLWPRHKEILAPCKSAPGHGSIFQACHHVVLSMNKSWHFLGTYGQLGNATSPKFLPQNKRTSHFRSHWKLCWACLIS